jgi:hypothetical protein
MLKLRTFSEAPPFLRYRVPESGEVIPPVGQEVHNYNDLEDAVRAHYRANQLKVPANLPALIQDQLCRQIPSRFCSDENGNVLRDGSNIFGFNFDVVKQGTATIVDWFVRGGAKKVSTDETARRSKICSTCAFNQPVPGCSSCNSASLHGSGEQDRRRRGSADRRGSQRVLHLRLLTESQGAVAAGRAVEAHIS